MNQNVLFLGLSWFELTRTYPDIHFETEHDGTIYSFI